MLGEKVSVLFATFQTSKTPLVGLEPKTATEVPVGAKLTELGTEKTETDRMAPQNAALFHYRFVSRMEQIAIPKP